MDDATPRDGRTELVERFFSGTGSTYDAMVNWATFGIDRLWKRRMVELIPPGSTHILDLACGTGISTLAIARRYINCQVVGVELREEYLRVARAKLRQEGIANVTLVLSRAEDYTPETRFDCITSSYLAKYAELPLLVGNCKRLLNDGGLFMMHDFTLPPNRFLLGVFRLYFKTMQQTVARLVPAWREIYYGLPELIEQARWLDELQEALVENGFRDIRLEYLTLYGSAIVTARKA